MAFTLGLMHGIGQLQMHAGMPQAMVPLDKQMSVLDARRAQFEKESLGFNYCEVSAELARIWNYPQPLIDALRSIAQPLSAPEFSDAAAWVHMGAWRARCEVLELSEEEQLASYPLDVSKRLNLEPNWAISLATLSPDAEQFLMPVLSELTDGLEVMFE
jgi:HD-like signal output (HDOD) protein